MPQAHASSKPSIVWFRRDLRLADNLARLLPDLQPLLQGQKFDPQGQYVRRWCPELARLPDAHIHRPFDAPADVLAEAGVFLGNSYPKPIVDHHKARQRVLEALNAIRREVAED